MQREASIGPDRPHRDSKINEQPEELHDHDGRRQPSMGGTSRVSREAQARICERLGVQFPGPTRPRMGRLGGVQQLASTLPTQPCIQLNNPCSRGRCELPEIRRIDTGTNSVEIGMIQPVQEVSADLELEPFGQRHILRQ
jgi:hypothetical protein